MKITSIMFKRGGGGLVYQIYDHKHRFAVWAASRASSVKGCRFSVLQGKLILERSGMSKLGETPNNLPSTDAFDLKHREWRERVIEVAEEIGLVFTHGVAAKLINVYLKLMLVCSEYHEDVRVSVIHPPIDAILLDSLCKDDVGGLKKNWKRAVKKRWSKFDSASYERVIADIRKVTAGDPLWKAEKYWRGYQ